MRRYETIFITPETLPDEIVHETAEKIQGIIQKMGGKVVRTDYWGRRTLSYEIKKQRRGQYVLLVYVAGPAVVAEVERNLLINENVIRFHSVKVADNVDINTVQPEESKPAPMDLFAERAARPAATEEPIGEELVEDGIA